VIAWAVRLIAIWGIVGLVMWAVVVHRLLPLAQNAPSQAVAAPALPPAPAASVPNSLMYNANAQGHVLLDGAVNGAPVRFLVDTGATYVALTRRDAAEAGIGNGELAFNHAVSTANGVAHVAQVTLREVRVGQFSVSDVPAMVVENLNVSLLGQSFLNRLDSYEMRNGVLTLNWN
jgi:aspartyl protease family protein